QLLRRLRLLLWPPYALHCKARALLNLGRVAEARATLMDARDEAATLPSRHAWWRILGTLVELETREGNRDDAEKWRHEAEEVIRYIADHAGSPELRSTFLSLPDVRALVAQVEG
ncbi:MAG: hypothetical protein ACRDIB_02625, partial [Ardenticatenaceae bacterium]